MGTFRYKVTAVVDGVIELDEVARLFRFRQGLRQVQVPLGNVRAFGVRRREKNFLGITASELLLRTEPSPGVKKVVKMPIDLESEGGRGALAALAAALPREADVTALAWDEAAARLGVPARAWTDFMMTRWGMLGVLLCAGAAGAQAASNVLFPTDNPVQRRARAVSALVLFVVGAVCMVIGHRRTRP